MSRTILNLTLAAAVLAGCQDDPLENGPRAVASVSVSSPSNTLAEGEEMQLSARALDADQAPLEGRSITWSSSDDAIAVVSAGGLVRALAPGSVTIRATSEGKVGQAVVTISRLPVSSVALAPAGDFQLERGSSVQLVATPRAANGNVVHGRTVYWNVADAGVASVSPSGLLTTHGTGTTLVSATVEGITVWSRLTVTTMVDRVELNVLTGTIDIHETLHISAQPKGRDGIMLNTTVTWSSSNPAVATVAGAGRVTGVGAGTAVITATSEGKSASATITVAPWTRQRLLSANGIPLPAKVQIAEKLQNGSTQLFDYEIRSGVFRMGPNGRYQLLFDGIFGGGLPTGVESVGQVFYNFLDGTMMLFPDGSDTVNGSPQFRSVPQAGAFVLLGPLQPGGPDVRLTFQQP